MAPKFELTEANFRRFHDFIPGLPFIDIMPALKKANVFKGTIDLFVDTIKTRFPEGFDYIAGIELRGVPYASVLAYLLGVGLIVVRKKGKLPGQTFSSEYSHDYAKDILELQADAVEPGAKVLLLDDIFVTGGTLKTACHLLQKIHANVIGCVVMVEKPAAPGRENFEKALPGVKLFSLVQLTYDGKKPLFDPLDYEQEEKFFRDFLKGLWKDPKLVDEAMTGAVKT